MSKLWRIAYNGIVVPAAGAALLLARRTKPAIERAAADRDGLFERWEAALQPLGDRSPRIWIHAASAGETLQARPLAEEIRRARPGAALVYTHFSPSARRWASDLPAVDVADYLPFDFPRRMGRFLDLLAPDLLILVGGETWPNMVWSATDRDVPVVQACARLVGADRMEWPVRGLTARLAATEGQGRILSIEAEVLVDGAVDDQQLAALREAGLGCRISRAMAVPVTLLRVIEGRTPGEPPEDPLGCELRRKEAAEYLESLAAGCPTLDGTLEGQVVEGNVAEQICLWVEHHGADLTVLSSHGMSGASDWRLASNALKLAEREAASNGVAGKCRFVAANVFDELRVVRDAGTRFDLVVLDPPKFVHSADQVTAGSRGYKDINMLGLALVRPGGVLATFSCSGHVDAALFQKIVAGAAVDAGRTAQILERLSQPPDHPVATEFPEADYLKGLVLRVH